MDDEIAHPTPPTATTTAADRSNERTALLGSSTSRDYHTEAQRDREVLAREGELTHPRTRPYSLRIDFAIGAILLLVNGYFWSMSLAAIKSPYIQHTALPAHRGSMFLPVWISFLSCTLNTASLVAFALPHEAPLLAFYTSLGVASYALIALIIAVSVTQLRVIEGVLVFVLLALALVSALHAALSAALTDKYAPLLDPPEELDPAYEEPTGVWASVKRGLRAGLGFLGISLPIAAAHVAVLACFILLTVNLIIRGVDSSVEQPGQRWKVRPDLWERKHFPELGRGLFQSLGRDYRVHLSCRGLALDDPPALTAASTNSSSVHALGRPTVRRTILLESDQGIPGEVDAEWVLKMLRDGDLNSGDVETRVCWWDRPGYGFSDGSPSSSTPYLVTALTQALSVSGELARLEPPPSLAGADVDASVAPSPLARSGLVLVSRGRSTAITALFATINPRLVHSFLYITPSSFETTVFRKPALTRFAAIPHFFTRTIPAVWTELGLRRLWWTIRGVSRKRRVLAREGEKVSGLIERAGLQERYERERGRESDGAKAWERRRGRYPNRPTVVLGLGKEGDDRGATFVDEIVGEGLRKWDQKWDGGNKGCSAGGEEEQACRNYLRELLSLD